VAVINSPLLSLFLPYLWGMETSILLKLLSVRTWFLPYLWGMETNSRYNWQKHTKKFLPYLWGMETGACPKAATMVESSYRTYEEWKPSWILRRSYFIFSVLTVPMRNGNCGIYNLTCEDYIVLTVPMRNGNMLLYHVLRSWVIVLTVPMRNGNRMIRMYCLTVN